MGRSFEKALRYADIISGESKATLDLIKKKMISQKNSPNLFLAYNGNVTPKPLRTNFNSFEYFANKSFAITVGTYSYKRIDLTLKLFDKIKSKNSLETLVIIGSIKPKVYDEKRKDIIYFSHLSHTDLMYLMSRSKVFISASEIENSSNAALEGVCLSQEVYLSNIPSHAEIFKKMPLICKLDNMEFLNFKKESTLWKNELVLSKTWDEVLKELKDFGEAALNQF